MGNSNIGNGKVRKMLRKGQAMVLVLLVSVVLIIVSTMAVSLVVTNALSTTREERGAHALEIAESGAEEGILRVLRDPTVEVTGLTLTVDAGSATVDITGSGTKTITSQGQIDGYTRRVQVELSFADGQVLVDSWEEL